MVGELAVTIVGTYDTLALAVAAMDAGVDPAATDYHKLIQFQETGAGQPSFAVIKSVRTA